MSEFNQENQNYQSTPFQTNNLDDFAKPNKPNNNLVLSIVGTVLGVCSPCCIGFILGIIAIVFSTQVDTKYNANDYQGAESSAKTAKILALIAIILFALTLIYYATILITGGMTAIMEQYQEIIDQVQ